jgi:hypothetical protein
VQYRPFAIFLLLNPCSENENQGLVSVTFGTTKFDNLCTVYWVLCTGHCVLCTVYCVLGTVYCVLCTGYSVNIVVFWYVGPLYLQGGGAEAMFTCG